MRPATAGYAPSSCNNCCNVTVWDIRRCKCFSAPPLLCLHVLLPVPQGNVFTFNITLTPKGTVHSIVMDNLIPPALTKAAITKAFPGASCKLTSPVQKVPGMLLRCKFNGSFGKPMSMQYTAVAAQGGSITDVAGAMYKPCKVGAGPLSIKNSDTVTVLVSCCIATHAIVVGHP